MDESSRFQVGAAALWASALTQQVAERCGGLEANLLVATNFTTAHLRANSKPACTTSILLVLGTQPPNAVPIRNLSRFTHRDEFTSICIYDLNHSLLFSFSCALRSRLGVAPSHKDAAARSAPPDSYVTQASHRNLDLHTSSRVASRRLRLVSIVNTLSLGAIKIAVTRSRRFT